MPKAKAKETVASDGYIPPHQSWDLLKFIEATPEELAAKTVDCATCPVALLCNAGVGGTGIFCTQCEATSVFCVDENKPSNVIVMDCTKHRFEKTDPQVCCSLCSGSSIKFAMRGLRPFQHYVHTKHASYDARTRQERLKEAHTQWLDHAERVARANENRKK
jgi:hypothetical protein